MRKLLNTLYILTPDSYLFCQNEAIVIKVGGAEKVRIPSHGIESIVCFAYTTVSTPFIGFCGERNISLSFHSEYGKFYGRIYGPVSGNVLLRKKQFMSLADMDFLVSLAKMMLAGKLTNSRNLLQRAVREAADSDCKASLDSAAGKITRYLKQLNECTLADELRSMEAVAATAYFGAFDDMIKTDQPGMQFERRSRRPPENNVNALLSFLYALLRNDMQSALESVGLDPAVGFFHTLRPGRPALALDMMEELRAPLCDRLALALINRGQLQGKDFTRDGGGINLTGKARKVVLTAWQERKQEAIIHPFLKEKLEIGLIPYAQSMLLARLYRGDMDMYPPFIWR